MTIGRGRYLASRARARAWARRDRSGGRSSPPLALPEAPIVEHRLRDSECPRQLVVYGSVNRSREMFQTTRSSRGPRTSATVSEWRAAAGDDEEERGASKQEILGLAWGDIDLRELPIRVRAQLSRGTKASPPRRVDLKTKAGRRDIALAGQPEPHLRDHVRATERSTRLPRPDAYVFHRHRYTAQPEQRCEARSRQSCRGGGPQWRRCDQARVPRSPAHVRESLDPSRCRSCSRISLARACSSEHHARHLRA
jgi:hypothetical protein